MKCKSFVVHRSKTAWCGIVLVVLTGLVSCQRSSPNNSDQQEEVGLSEIDDWPHAVLEPTPMDLCGGAALPEGRVHLEPARAEKECTGEILYLTLDVTAPGSPVVVISALTRIDDENGGDRSAGFMALERTVPIELTSSFDDVGLDDSGRLRSESGQRLPVGDGSGRSKPLQLMALELESGDPLPRGRYVIERPQHSDGRSSSPVLVSDSDAFVTMMAATSLGSVPTLTTTQAPEPNNASSDPSAGSVAAGDETRPTSEPQGDLSDGAESGTSPPDAPGIGLPGQGVSAPEPNVEPLAALRMDPKLEVPLDEELLEGSFTATLTQTTNNTPKSPPRSPQTVTFTKTDPSCRENCRYSVDIDLSVGDNPFRVPPTSTARALDTISFRDSWKCVDPDDRSVTLQGEILGAFEFGPTRWYSAESAVGPVVESLTVSFSSAWEGSEICLDGESAVYGGDFNLVRSDPTPLNDLCRIELRARRVTDFVFAWHHYIWARDQWGREFAVSGQPSSGNPPWGRLRSYVGLFEPGFPEVGLKHAATMAAEGAKACSRLDCLIDEGKLMDRAYDYLPTPLGRFANSNTVAATVMDRCGLSVERVPGAEIAPGFFVVNDERPS